MTLLWDLRGVLEHCSNAAGEESEAERACAGAGRERLCRLLCGSDRQHSCSARLRCLASVNLVENGRRHKAKRGFIKHISLASAARVRALERKTSACWILGGDRIILSWLVGSSVSGSVLCQNIQRQLFVILQLVCCAVNLLLMGPSRVQSGCLWLLY